MNNYWMIGTITVKINDIAEIFYIGIINFTLIKLLM